MSAVPVTPGLSASEGNAWFEENVLRYEPGLRAFLRSNFPSIADIDDLVQEAYARFFKAKSQGAITSPRSFLYATARNIACDYFRRNRTTAVGGLEAIDRLGVLDSANNASDALSRAEELEVLGEAIQALPPRCRDIFVLRRLQGLAYKEIAERLGISECSVNTQLAIGITRCRAFLLARGLMEPKPGSSPVSEDVS